MNTDKAYAERIASEYTPKQTSHNIEPLPQPLPLGNWLDTVSDHFPWGSG